jgi:hypothetical protein
MTARGYTTEEQGRLNNFAVEPKMYVKELLLGLPVSKN